MDIHGIEIRLHGKGSLEEVTDTAHALNALTKALGLGASATTRMVCDSCGAVSQPVPTDLDQAHRVLLENGRTLNPDTCPNCTTEKTHQ